MVSGLVDTSILIDYVRGYTPAKDWLQKQQLLGVHAIAYMELVQGAPDSRALRIALRVLREYERINMTDEDFSQAIFYLTRYQLSHNVGMNDCMIAASAHRLDLPLFTRNIKHYKPLIGNLVIEPY